MRSVEIIFKNKNKILSHIIIKKFIVESLEETGKLKEYKI